MMRKSKVVCICSRENVFYTLLFDFATRGCHGWF